MKNQSGDSVIIIYLSTNAFSVKKYRYRNVLCRSSTRHRHSIKRKDIAWHFSPKQLLLTTIFLLTKHQNIFVINLQNRYIYDLLDCISLIALFKIIQTYIFFMLITIIFYECTFFKKAEPKMQTCKHGYWLITNSFSFFKEISDKLSFWKMQEFYKGFLNTEVWKAYQPTSSQCTMHFPIEME